MYRQQPQHGGNIGDYPYSTTSDGQSFVYSQFPGTIGNVPHPGFQQDAQHLSPPRRRPQPTSSPSHSRNMSVESAGQQAQKPPSPRIRNVTPKRASENYTPTDRSLPNREVTADDITDAYVAFILFCNPQFGLDVDTTTLRTSFQGPPKSDNKDFEVYRLFELIKLYDAKEIKTWGQLALELGVEAPDVSKGQSVQKVQQYSVRLKRWMHAMHVDAFFEFLLHKPHGYYQDLPDPADPYSKGRDGVPPEEDLAIRALDPSFRPKRGRRRNSEAEADQDPDANAQAATETPYPRSAHPASAYPSVNFSFSMSSATDPWVNTSAAMPHDFNPWPTKLDGPQSAIASTAPSHMRWQTPTTPHPMTAFPGSMMAPSDSALEPKSAVVSSSRKRRKHGPAVSSAWPSANAPGAKPRGRPPASRNMQDGPFTTFPADPANDKKNHFHVPSSNMTARAQLTQEPTAMESTESSEQRQSEGPSRPGRLSLQVPRHTGGPVRLATPPMVTVTNESSPNDEATMKHGLPDAFPPNLNEPHSNVLIDGSYCFETLKRALASDLLRAQMLGRQHRLTGEEAKRLADSVLQRLDVPRESNKSTANVSLATAASWLGLAPQLIGWQGTSSSQGKRITATRIRLDAEGYEEIVPAYEPDVAGSSETFDLSWTSSMGSCNGIFELKGLSLADPPPKPFNLHDAIIESWAETAKRLGIDEKHVDDGRKRFADASFHLGLTSSSGPSGNDNIDWKAKYQALEFGTRMAKGEFLRYRERLIERVLETLI